MNNNEIVNKIAQARDNLYEAMPSGSIEAFDLIKIISKHLGDLDAIIDELNPLRNH